MALKISAESKRLGVMPVSAATFPVRHLIAELRYTPTLGFYSAMDKIGIALGEHYPDWERSPLTLEVRDKNHRRRCYLSQRT